VRYALGRTGGEVTITSLLDGGGDLFIGYTDSGVCEAIWFEDIVEILHD